MAFFERVRVELSKYEAGVHELGPAAPAAAIRDAERRVGAPLPREYAELLQSFDHMGLFADTFTLFGAREVERSEDGSLLVGRTPDGTLHLDADGRLFAASEAGDRILCGTTVERWLIATLQREALIVSPDGEWRDVFGDDGGLSPTVQKKRTRVGVRTDPDAALWRLESAELAFEQGRLDEAERELAWALKCDERAAEAWELTAGLRRSAGRAEAAADAFLRAAEVTVDPVRRARRFAEAARLSQGDARHEAAKRARTDDPGCGERWDHEAQARLLAEDAEGALHLAELAAAVGAKGGDALAKSLRLKMALRTV